MIEKISSIFEKYKNSILKAIATIAVIALVVTILVVAGFFLLIILSVFLALFLISILISPQKRNNYKRYYATYRGFKNQSPDHSEPKNEDDFDSMKRVN